MISINRDLMRNDFLRKKGSFPASFCLLAVMVIILATSTLRPSMVSAKEDNVLHTGNALDGQEVKEQPRFNLLSANIGWLILDNNLYWTDDGGRNWRNITPVDGRAAIRSVFFVNDHTGWAILISSDGSIPTFLLAITNDRGNTWQTKPVEFFAPGEVDALSEDIYLYMLDDQTGWVVFKRPTGSNFSLGALFRTRDGGDTWQRLSIPIGETVYFVNEIFGWTASGVMGNEIYNTHDGGKTWQRQSIPSDDADRSYTRIYHLPRFEDPSRGLIPIVVLGKGDPRVEIYITKDGGGSWNMRDSIPLGEGFNRDSPLPISLLDAGSFVIVAPNLNQIVRGGSRERISNIASDLSSGIVEVDMATPDIGWAKHSSSQCESAPMDAGLVKSITACTQELRLLHTEDGGRTWDTLILPGGASVLTTRFEVENQPQVDEEHITPLANTSIFQGQGFDKCEIPSLGQMQTWWTSSPYYVVNLYMGGAARSCPNSALSSTYLIQLNQQGWKFIPTWVGPQAPCTTFKSRISSNPATAYAQGITEADLAIDVAAGLGLTYPDKSGTIVYYDLEAYNTGDSACRNAVKSFINGWVTQLHSRGNQAGVYGSACGSALNDFIGITSVPDAIWPAKWSYSTYTANVSVFGLSCIPDSNWANHQRIRQYTGTHTETWGGVAMTMDSNAMDGIIAIPSVASPPVAPSPSGPSNGQFFNEGQGITLSWTATGNEYFGEIWGGPGGTLTFGWQTGISKDIGPQWAGYTYSWHVKARNGYGESSWSDTWTFAVKPAAPSALSGSAASCNSANLSWGDNSGSEQGFRVYRNGQSVGAVGSNATNWTDSNLSGGTSYSYYVKAYQGTIESDASNTVNVTTPACEPAAPTLSSPVNNATFNRTDSITLAWSMSSGATQYYAEFWGGPGVGINSGWISGTTWALGVQWGGAYQWRVKARNISGQESGWSETRALAVKFGSPTNLSAPIISQNQVNLSWNASADAPGNIDGYRIYQNGAPVGTSNNSTVTFNVTNLVCGTAYNFYVTAYKGAFESDASNTVSATTKDCPPGGFGKSSPINGTTVQPNNVTLTWEPSSGAASYAYCYDTVNNNFCDTTWNTTTSTSVNLGNLGAGTNYYWQVRAKNAGGTTYADGSVWWAFSVQTESLVRIVGVRTADGNWNAKTIFNPGDSIQWIIEVENNTGQEADVQLTYTVTGPAGQSVTYWQGNVTTAPGILWWGLPGTVPENMGGLHVFEGTATYQSMTTKASTSYTVAGPSAVDDRAFIIQYNGWAGVTDLDYSGGGYRKTSIANETLTYKAAISAGSFTFLTYRGPDQGKAQILVDGSVKKTLDLYSASPELYSVQVTGLSIIKHTIVIKALGQKNALSTGAEVRVDGFLIKETTIEENDPTVKYSNWTGKVSTSAYGGSYLSSAKTGAAATFQLTGTSFTWVTAKGPAYGKAQVIVDGNVVQVIDLYFAATIWQYKVVISGLDAGLHTVQIQVLGTRNPKSKGNTVIVDGLIFSY